jgi:hypothetical protein
VDVGLTKDERRALLWLAKTTNMILSLPECHPADAREIVLHIHAIQNAIMARAAVRAHPHDFTHHKDFQ